MRLATCQLPEGGTIAVQTKDSGRVFRGGDVVDLDAIAVPADGERPALTWAVALGEHVEQHFAVHPPKRGRAAAALTESAVSAHQEE